MLKFDIHKIEFSKIVNIIVVFLLGITTFMSAYASWQASLYSGSQSSYYTEATTIMEQANSMYNEALQEVVADVNFYSDAVLMYKKLVYTKENGTQAEANLLQSQFDFFINSAISSKIKEKLKDEAYLSGEKSPFDDNEFISTYFEEAEAKSDQGKDTFNQGESDNDYSDTLGAATVVFAIVMFLLGIVSTFDSVKIKIVVTVFSILLLFFALYVMLGVPMFSD